MSHARFVRPDQGSDDYFTSRPRAWGIFTMTFLLMVFDFIDRQIIVSMFPFLKTEWALSDTQLGALVSVVSITVALGTFPVALLVDRWSRVKGIALMASVWSLATLVCGFTRTFGQLFTARALIGLGEAGYGPAGAALLSTMFPARLRGTVMGAFQAAAPIGSVIGVVLGGVIAARWGWRAAFGVVSLPGLILALLFLLVRDYQTVAFQPREGAKIRARDMAAELFRARSGVAAYLGGALQLFVVATVFAWLPSYLNRAYGLSGSRAGAQAAVVVLLGSIGTVFWGHVADRLSHRDPRRKLLLPAACALTTFFVLSVTFTLVPPGRLQFGLIALGGFVMTATVGPVAAVALDVIHPGLRATAGSMVALVQNLFGLAAGPLVAGVISDAYGLQASLAIIPSFCVLSAGAFLFGSQTYEQDVVASSRVPDGSNRGVSAGAASAS